MSGAFGPQDIDFLIEDMSPAQLARLSQRLGDRATGFLAPPQAVAANLATPVQAGVVQIEYLSALVDTPPTALNSDSLIRSVLAADVNVAPGATSAPLELLVPGSTDQLAGDNWLVLAELYFTRPLPATDTSGVTVAGYSSGAPSDVFTSLLHAEACSTTAAGALQRTIDKTWDVTAAFGPFWTGTIGTTPFLTPQHYAVQLAGIWTGGAAPTSIGLGLTEPGGVNPLTFCAGSWILGARRAH